MDMMQYVWQKGSSVFNLEIFISEMHLVDQSLESR